MSEFAHAEVVAVNGVYQLQWQLHTPQTVSVYKSHRALDGFEHWLTTDKTALALDQRAHDRRCYYLLKTETGDEYLVSQRRFDLDGAPNVRDFGGYKTADGAMVPWGKFYRAGRLSGLTAADIGFFQGLNIQDIFDFRRLSEAEKSPHNLGENHTSTIHPLPISPGSHVGFVDKIESGQLTPAQSADGMVGVYQDLALGQTEQYARVLQHLLHSDAPLLINCSAGKDRTGVGAAKILLLLGVDRDTILSDYLLTHRYFPNEAEYAHFERDFGGNYKSREVLEPLMTVRPEYLLAYFKTIDDNFASEADYFERAYGITPAQTEAIKSRHLV